jgi:serine/threonine-protein kinase RsbT
MSGESDGELAINTEGDIVAARRTVRGLAVEMGFGLTDVTRIVTAASELARNIFKYGGGGVMRWRQVEEAGRPGIELQFIDHGPGIADIDLALQEGYSTGRGLGLGLPAARRLMDEMDIQSTAGKGTQITLKKWRAH